MTTDEIIQSLTMWSKLIHGTSVRLTDDFVSDLQGTLKAAAERLSEVCPVVPEADCNQGAANQPKGHHPMTRKDILELSTKLAQAEQLFNDLQIQDSLLDLEVLDPERKVAREAQYRLALTWVDKARKDYNDAIGSLSADQLERLAKGEEI